MNTNNTNQSEPQPKRCAIYCRKSTDHGMDQQYTSIDAQSDSCRNYIAAHAAEGWVVSGVYADVAVSGATLDRPEMKRLLADVEAGRIDCIVTYKLDRVSRSVRDFSNLIFDLEKKGVSLVITTQNFDTSTPMGRMCTTFLSSFAEFERSMTISRIRDKAMALARQGMWNAGTPPYGYRLGEGRKLLLDEAAAGVVRRIFDMAAQGASCNEIRQVLVRQNISAPRGRDPKTWNGGGIRNILARRLYVGKMVCQGVEYQGQHEAIVTESLWNAAQVGLKPSRKYKHRDGQFCYPLKDLLYCPDCGSLLYAGYCGSHGRFRRYYTCLVHKRHRDKCSFTGFSALSIEQTVARHLATLADDADVVEAIRARLPQLDRLDIRAALLDVEQLVGNLSDAALDTIFHALYEKITFDPATSTLNFTRHSA